MIQNDGIAAETQCFLRRNLDQIRDTAAHGLPGVLVKGFGKPQGSLFAQWAEAGIEMIKPWIGQLQGNDFAFQPFLQQSVRMFISAERAPTEKYAPGKQGITFAFKRCLIGHRSDLEVMIPEPLFKQRCFSSALGVSEIGPHELGIGD